MHINLLPVNGKENMRILLLGVWFGVILGCKSEPPLFDKNKVKGTWIVTEASRNNRITQTVNGAVFKISDTELTHNLYGSDSSYAIQWSREAIVTGQAAYTVETAQDSLLVLATILHNFPFRLSLKKTTPPQTEE